MQKRWIPFVLLCIMSSFLAGQWLGATSQATHAYARHLLQANMQTTIAVVNADAGVTVDGEFLNYSSAIIETLGQDFVLVSPAMAHSGYVSGIYGAIITFPSDVSYRILSFNTDNPIQVMLEFQINPNLSERDFIETYKRIVDLQTSINSTLAYTYVSSILEQFHAGQDQINAIFQNNIRGLEALDTVRLHSFTGVLQLDEFPGMPLVPNEPVTAHHFLSVVDFAQRVSDIYLGSFGRATEDYLYMREGLISLTDNFPYQEEEWISALSDWTNISVNFGEALTEYSSVVRNHTDELVGWHTRAMGWNQRLEEYQNEALYWFEAATSWNNDLYFHQNELIYWYSFASSWHENLERRHEEAEQWHELAIELNINLEEYQTDINNWYTVSLAWNEYLTEHQSNIQDWHDELQLWYNSSYEWYFLNQEYLTVVEEYLEEVGSLLYYFVNNTNAVIFDLNQLQSSLYIYGDLLLYLSRTYDTYANEINNFLINLIQWHGKLYQHAQIWQNTVITAQNTILQIPPFPGFDPYDPNGMWDVLNWVTQVQHIENQLSFIVNDMYVNVPGFDSDKPLLQELPLLNWTDVTFELPFPNEIMTDIPDLTLPMPEETIPSRTTIKPPEVFEYPFPEVVEEPPVFTVVTIESPPEITFEKLGEPPELYTEEPGSLSELDMEGPGYMELLTFYTPENPLVEAPPRPDAFWYSLGDMHGQLLEFDVGAYLTISYRMQVYNMIRGYESYLDIIRADLTSQFGENIAMLMEVRHGYTYSLHNLRMNALLAESYSLDNLNRNIYTFSNIVDGRNSDTHNRLSVFAGMMPLSRTPVGLNHDMVRFAVAPFEFISPQIREALTTEPTGDYMAEVYELYLLLSLPVLILSFIVTILSYWWKIDKERNKSNLTL